MTAERLRIDAADRGGAARLILVGDLDLSTAPMLDRHVDDLVRENGKNLQIDLAGVRFIDSKGLAILVSASRKATSDGRSLVLTGLHPHQMRIFEVTGLVRLFEFA